MRFINPTTVQGDINLSWHFDKVGRNNHGTVYRENLILPVSSTYLSNLFGILNTDRDTVLNESCLSVDNKSVRIQNHPQLMRKLN